MVWKGVIIEESLENNDIFDLVEVVGEAESFLGSEENKGVMHFKMIEVKDDKKEGFVDMAKKSIRSGWYIHICKDNKMVVIFKDRCFEFGENEKDKIEAAKKYGISVGIIPEQMEFENLIRNPYD